MEEQLANERQLQRSRSTTTNAYFTAVDEVHDEVQLVGRLKRVLQGDEKWMTSVLHQNISFGHYMAFFSLSLDQCLADHFHCIDHVFILMPSQVDFAEGAFADARAKFEVIGFNAAKIREWRGCHVVERRAFTYEVFSVLPRLTEMVSD